MTTHLPPASAAEVVRGVLKKLADLRLAPTPENYARAYALVLGEPQRDVSACRPEGPVQALDDLTDLLEDLCDNFGIEGGYVRGLRRALDLPSQPAAKLESAVSYNASQAEARKSLREAVYGFTSEIRNAVNAIQSELGSAVGGLSSLEASTEQYAERANQCESLGQARALLGKLAEEVREVSKNMAESNKTLQQTQAVLNKATRQLQLVEQERSQAEYLAAHDPLTGLLNRRGLEAAMDELPRCGAAILLLDIDNFKKVNDEHGHGSGDLMLQKFARVLKTNTREADHVARLGGEEFVVVFPGLTVEEAVPACSRILRGTRDIQIAGIRHGKMSTSGGLAYVAGKRSWDDEFSAALEEADKRLYVAKRSGKDRIEMGQSLRSMEAVASAA